MSLFNRGAKSDPSSTHFFNVIKNTASGEFLLWKNPEEDFNDGSTLIVAENEQALFVKDGLVQQVFNGGRYSLDTENYPFLSSLRNALSGGVSSFHCEIYYVRVSDSHEVYWGTKTPIQIRDPVVGIPVSIRARGSYRIRVGNAKQFFLKMVGNNELYFTQEEVVRYCQSQFEGIIKSVIAKELAESHTEILGVCENQLDFAKKIRPLIEDVFSSYGLLLVNFAIEALDVPMDDPYRLKIEMANAERIAMLQTGQASNLLEADRIDQVTGARSRAFDRLGANWGRQQSADILNGLATNPSSGGIASLGAGLGVGVAAGGSIGSMAQNLFFVPNQEFSELSGNGSSNDCRADVDQHVDCPVCGSRIVAGCKFCPECGQKIIADHLCSGCGAVVRQESKYCPECGRKLT